MKKQSAFTLIELSIVLVIIGLIVGGVLVGQDLINSASIRNQISQIEQMDLAVNTFKLKYDCLPGDCSNATQFFAASSQPEQVFNGDGNRNLSFIDLGGDGSIGFFEGEQAFFYDHLAAANLISLSQFDEEEDAEFGVIGVGFPESQLGAGGLAVGITAPDQDLPGNQHQYLLGGGQVFDVVLSTETPTLRAADALTLDTKMDDGRPLTGKVVAAREGAEYFDPLFSNLAIPAASGGCVTTATNNPYSIIEGQNCAILIKAGF